MEDALWAQLQNTGLEEHDDKDRIEADSDEEQAQVQEELSVPHEERLQGPQTGPKGVKADHEYHQQKKLVSETKARAEYNARLLAKAPTTTTYSQDEANKPREELLVLQAEEEEDDLKYYREKRLRELKNQARQQRVFGRLTTISVDEYADEIDEEWANIPVIVHLYDDSIPTCKLLDEHLRGLSNKYSLAKFIRVSAIQLEFDLVESPAILVYKNGILIANLVRIIDEVSTRFDIDEIEDILTRHGALSENDLYDLPTNDAQEE